MGKPKRVRLVATDEQGIVRVVEAPALTQLDAMEAVARWGDGDKKLAVECSALHVNGGVGWTSEGSSVLALGRASGETHLVDPETGRTLATIPAVPAAADAEEEEAEATGGGDGDGALKKSSKKVKSNPVRGLSFLYDAVGTGCTRFPLLVVASASGKVRVFAPPAGFFPSSASTSPSAAAAAAAPSSSSSSSSSWALVSKFDAAPKGGLRAISLAQSPGSSKAAAAAAAAAAAGAAASGGGGVGGGGSNVSSGGNGNGSVVRVAVVSDSSELTVWDLAAREKVFEAKGEKPDRLRLVDRVAGTAVCFLPDADGQVVSAPDGPGGLGPLRCSGALVAVGTGTGRVRLYDSRHGKRPVASVVLSGGGGGGRAGCSTDSAARMAAGGSSSSPAAPPPRNNGLSGAGAAVTALAPEAGGAALCRAWAGDAAGLLRSVDLRTARPEGVLKGAAGGVRSAAPHPRAALVASAGADGFLRVHHSRTRKLVGSLWLKQPLRSVCWCPVAAPASGGGDGGGDEKKKEKKKAKKRRRESEEEDASSSGSDSDDEQSFLEASNLSLLPPEETGKGKKKKKKAALPPLPGARKEKKARKKGGSAKKNKLRKEAAKAAKQAKYAAARGGGGGGDGGGGE